MLAGKEVEVGRNEARRLTSDEKTGEDDHSLTSTRGTLGVLVVKDKVTNSGETDEASKHKASTNDQGLATTKVLDDVETTESGTEVDGTQNDLSDKAVVDTSTSHDGSSVVEEVVGTGELLQRLQDHTQDDTEEHARGGQELVPFLLLAFSGLLLTDLIEFFQDTVVVLRNTVELGQVATGLINTTLTEVETRRFGEEQHATTQGQSKDKGQAQGDTPLSGVLDMLGTQVEEVGQEDTKGDKQLVATDNGTTDVTGGRFTYDCWLVQSQRTMEREG